MKNGICPKCNGKEVHLYKNTGAELAISVGFLGSASVVYYICTDCGYVELFVEDKSKLPKIAEKYPRVRIS